MLDLFADLMQDVEVLRVTVGGVSTDGYATPLEGEPDVVATLPMSIQANRRQSTAAPGSNITTAAYLAYCAPHPQVAGTGFTLRAADGMLYEPETDALDVGGQGEVLLIPLKAPKGREA